MRVFIGLKEIAGFFGQLQRGLAAEGVDATFVQLRRNALQYDTPVEDPFTPLFFRIEDLKDRFESRFAAIALELLACALLALCFVWAVFRFDVFVFSYRSSFFPYFGWIDYRLLRLLGKRVVYVCNGSDVRPPYLCGYLMDGDFSPERLNAMTRTTAKFVRAADRYANVVVGSPATGQFFTRELVNIYHIGIPYDPEADAVPAVAGQPAGDDLPLLLHCPSHMRGKGTSVIRDAVASLREKGLRFEYKELVGVSHAKVIAEIAACDIVLDQMYCDAPMAALACEAAAQGKPAVVGGYFAGMLPLYVPQSVVPPTAYCAPKDFVATLERLLTHPEERRVLGEAARQHVMEFRAARAVARRFLRVLRNDIPQEWRLDPATMRYACGGGIAREELRTAVRGLVDAYGSDALCLEGKAQLKSRLLAFARGEGGCEEDAACVE